MKQGLAKWRVRAGYPVAILYFWLAHPRPGSLAEGASVALVGLAIRGLAAGHLRKHEGLATTGPYAWTRNPLYFGSALLAAGLAIASGAWAAAAVVAAFFLAFYPATLRSEESELAREYGEAFREYAARVPLFWPRRPRGGAPGAKFSWALYRRNREYNAAVGMAVVVALLAAKMIWAG